MKQEYKVGSLFAGVGGITLGFKKAETQNSKYKLLWANEMDQFACETFRNNFSHSLLEGDLTKILKPELVDIEIKNLEKKVMVSSGIEHEKLKKELTEKLTSRDDDFEKYTNMHKLILNEPIDILEGGFPCQAFSIAGEQKGFDDERGNLFLSIIELINQLGEKHYKPRVLLLENVKNLKSHDNGRTYQVIKRELERCGYTIYEEVLNTMYYSDLPQNRERIYILGFLYLEDAQSFDYSFINKYKKIKSAEERVLDVKNIIDYSSDFDELGKYYYYKEKYPNYFASEAIDTENGKSVRINLDEEITEMYQFYQLRRGMYVRKNQSNVCPTLTANMGTGGHNVPLIKVKDGIRKITPKEAFKLQGFPVDEGYVLPKKVNGKVYADSHLYKQAGNAVSVPLVQIIATEILKILK